MTRYALWQQLVTYPAAVDRLLPAATWLAPGSVSGMAVTVGAGRVVNIAPGAFVVALGAGNGSALCVSDAVETATFAAAPGSGSSRIDLLIVQVHDSAIDSGGANGFTFDVVQGVPAASPVAPAVPARAGVLAQVTSVGGQANLAQSNIAYSDIASNACAQIGLSAVAVGNSTVNIPGTPAITAGITYASPTLTILHSGVYLVTYYVNMNGNGGNGAGSSWRLDVQRQDAAGNAQSLVSVNSDWNPPWPSATAAALYRFVAGDRITPQVTGAGMSAGVNISSGQFALARI